MSGRFLVASNMQRVWGSEYAQHTGGMNSFSIGISFAGMKYCVSAQRPGPCALAGSQVLAGLRFTAACCVAWGLDPPNPARCFHRREVWELHGIKGTQNHHKIDINLLSLLPQLKPNETGPWPRSRTAEFLHPPSLRSGRSCRRLPRLAGRRGDPYPCGAARLTHATRQG